MTGTEITIVDPDADIRFNNAADFCIGTGRMGLAMQQEYQEQLKLVQEQIGFSHIRGHGLFCDDMAIYHQYRDEQGRKKTEYNFTYLDRVMDSYMRLKIKPFLELGFMPEMLASGDQTVFYWKGNVTPPKTFEAWCRLVEATLQHLIDRYGDREVTSWPVEVWNEPNLACFWKDADMKKYFRLFELTFHAVKKTDVRFRVGGPAICGIDDERWMREFLSFCDSRKLPLDFVTRHHYATEIPDYTGHYGYAKLTGQDEGRKVLQTTRDIVDSFERYRGLEIHITEFNTSYIPNCPLHDTNLNAAYIAGMLSWLGDMNTSYSYWTFGDVFEEQGVPFTPFHGGFGLVADGCIRKPTFWTFCFFKKLRGDGSRCVYRADDTVIVKKAEGSYCGICWNVQSGKRAAKKTDRLGLQLENCREYCFMTQTVDEETCNPLKIWHSMGEPASLSAEQLELLRSADRPEIRAERCAVRNGLAEITLELKRNAVVYFEVYGLQPQCDRGFDYARAVN